MRVLSCTIVTLCLLISTTSVVNASFIHNTFGLASPTSTVTFSEISLPTYTSVTNQFASYGVTFSPNLYYNSQAGSWPNIVGDRLGNYGTQPLVDPFSILFTSIQSGAAFAAVTNIGNTTFTAKLGGVVVESFTVGTDYFSTNNFYGFQNILFDEIHINVGADGLMLLDNIQFQSVPVPSAIVLFGIGMSCLSLKWNIGRRRKQAL